jgi:hypothetical protein
MDPFLSNSLSLAEAGLPVNYPGAELPGNRQSPGSLRNYLATFSRKFILSGEILFFNHGVAL